MKSWDSIVENNDIDTLARILEYSSIRDYEESEIEQEKFKVLASIVAGKTM